MYMYMQLLVCVCRRGGERARPARAPAARAPRLQSARHVRAVLRPRLEQEETRLLPRLLPGQWVIQQFLQDTWAFA